MCDLYNSYQVSCLVCPHCFSLLMSVAPVLWIHCLTSSSHAGYHSGDKNKELCLTFLVPLKTPQIIFVLNIQSFSQDNLM